MKNLAHDTRRALRLGTALATGIIGILQGQAAFAQVITDISSDGGAVITPGNTFQIDLNGASRNIIWNDLHVTAGHELTFTDASTVTPYVALNTVVNGAQVSQIFGDITSQSNIAVWLINPQGMVFSSGSSFSGGHLVLSTLPAVNAGDTANILDRTGPIDLGQTGGNASAFPGAITIEAGASIDASLGTGAHVSLISQQIDVSGNINAPGDVGLVLGHAVTLLSSLGSPLGYTITAGTRLATSKLLATGTIDGANVRLAAISEDAVTGALLQVDSSATLTATADGGSVILNATRTNPGSASLVSDGTLQTTSTNGSVAITADGAATVTGTVTTAGTGTYNVTADTVTLGGTTAQTQFGASGVTITATGGNVTAKNALTLSSDGNIEIISNNDNAFVHSAVSAGGTYSVTGNAVTLGDGTAVLQQATGAIAITARTGDLTTGAGQSLVSTASSVNLDGSSGNVQIGGRVAARGNIVITAQDDVSIATYSAISDTGYIRSDLGDVSIIAGGSVYGIGNATTAADILADQSGIDGYAATGSLTVNASGDVYAGTLSAGTNLVLNIDGALLGSAAGSVGTNVPGGAIFANGAGGDVSVTAAGGGGSVALNRVEAAGNVTISGDQIAIGTLKSGIAPVLSDSNGDPLAATASYIGLLGVTGDYVLTLGGAPTVTTVVATEDISALPAYGPEFFDTDFGKVNLNATTGNITGAVGYGAQLGTITAGGYIDVDAGGIVANSVTSGTYVDLIATAGTLSLLGVTAGTTLTLDKQGGLLATPGDDLRVLAGTAGGTITATSNTSARIGLLSAIIGDISVTSTLGDISGARTGAAAALGTVSTTNLLSTAYGSADFTANTGSVTLNAANGGIQAGDINLVGGSGDITASARALTLDLAVAQRDLNLTATLGTLRLGTGSVGRTALVTKSGGSIANAGDEMRIGALVGGTTTAPGGTTVTSSTHVRANTIDDGQGSVSITATAGDVVINNRVFGTTNVDIAAGRDFQIANYVAPLASGYVQSLNGNVTINAGGSVFGIGGSATDLPTTARGIDGYSSAGNLTVNATGDAHIGTLQAVGYIALNIGGGLFGTNGIGVDVLGGAVFANGAGGTVSVYANGAGGVNVLNRVEAAGNITLKGEEIAVGTPLPGGTLFLLDLANNPLTSSNYYVGLSTVPDGFIVNLTDPATITNMIALEDTSGGVGTYAPEFFDNTVGKTDLDAGGRITGTVGAGAQLGTVSAGGFIDLTTGGIVADSVTAGGSINIVANTGTLSLLDVAALGGLTLTKNGGLIGNPGDDLRVVTGTSTGGATLVSNTSIRVGDFTDTTGNIALTATNGDISGLLLGAHSALPTTTAGTALSNDWDKANLTATLGSVTVTAAAGSAQLGTLTAGTDVFADALALTANSVVAGGLIDLAVTSGTLFLGTGTAGLNATLDKTGLGDELRVLTLTSGLAVGGASGAATVNSATNIRAQTVTAYGGSAQLTAFNGEITGITGVNSGRVNVFAREDLAAGNAPIAGTDLNAYLFGGTLIRAGTVEGGENALTYANIFSPALRSAQVDVTSIHARRGAAFAAVDNSVAGSPNGIQFGSIISDGGIAGAVALGTNSGNVVGTTVQGFAEVRLVSAAGTVNIGTAIAGNGTLGGTADATIDAFSDVNVTTLTAGATAAVLARNGSITIGTTMAGEDAAFSASQSAILTSVSARDDVAITAANARIGSASAVGGAAGIDARDVDFSAGISIGAATNTGSNLAVTATTGDISGLLTGTPGVLPITTGATQLSANYGRANLTATTGTITVTAAGGGAQLGTLIAGTNIVADALALTADSATASGLIDLAVTSGTLYLGNGSAGLSASLEKTGAGDELRFGTLVTGATPGGATADATVRSSTNIRGTSITARSGAILVEALNGQATGLAGGRLALSALGDLNGAPGSDLGIMVNTGGLARLGNLQAGTNILVTAQNLTTPPTFGAIDMLSATSARGDVRLRVDNAAPSGTIISFVDINAGNFARVDALGGVGGNIIGNNITGTNGAVVVANNGSVTLNDVLATNGLAEVDALGGNATLNSLIALNGNVLSNVSNDFSATTLQSSSDVTINAGGDIDATDIDATTFVKLDATRDITVGTSDAVTTTVFNAGNDIGVTSLTSGGNTDLTAGRDIISGTTSSTGGYAHFGAGRDIEASQLTAATDVQLTAGASIRAGQLTSDTSSVTLRANGGDITGLGGFSGIAANRPDILAAGAVLITSTGSTQLDTAQAGTSLTVTAGTATSDGKIDINTATAPGAILLDAFATSPATDANHDGGVRVGTADAGTTLTLTNVARGAGIGDITIGTLATSGSDAFIDAADNARIAQATVTNTLAIRAGDEISGLTAGSAANLTAGEDLALRSGAAVNLANATAGDDLVIESASMITAGALSVSGSGPDLRSISFASPTAITIVASASNGASIELRSSGGSVNTTGLLSATGSVTIDAADGASVTGGVTAGGNYSVTAVNAIQLGGSGATTQSANGAVTIRSTGTSPSSQVTQGGGLLTLTANSDNVGTEALSIIAPSGIVLGNAALSGASIGLISSGGSVTSDGTLTSVGDITVNAGNQANVTGAVTAGGNYSVTAANAIQLGGAGATAQSARGAVTITSTGPGPTSQVTQGGGALTLTANSDGLGAEALSITAPGGITLGTTALIGGDGGRQSAITLAASGGQITIGTASGARLGVTAQTGFTANGAITAGNDTLPADLAGGLATVDIAVTAGGITTDAITATGAGHDIRLAASGAIATGALNAARSVTASGAAAGSSATSFTAPSITATSGAIGVTAGSIAVAGAQTAGTTIDLDATNGALGVGNVTAGSNILLTATGGATFGSLTSTSSSINVTAGNINTSSPISAATTLDLKATAGNLNLGAGPINAGGNVNLTSTATITLGVLNAGTNSLTLKAADANINGMLTAGNITIINDAAAGHDFRLGDAVVGGPGAFELSADEVNRLAAATVVLDAGTGLTPQNVMIGNLTITNAAIRSLSIDALGRIDLTGNLVTGSTSALTALRLGGRTTAPPTPTVANSLASILRIAANAGGTGGRIDIGTGELDLRAAIIGVGQDTGFLDQLGVTPGTTLRVDPRLMVNNVQPGLYNSTQAGGLTYLAAGQQLIRASSMTVTYSNFALFQNTAPLGENSGAVLGSLAVPAAPALQLIGFGSPQAGAFAIFGQINGRGDIAAALLGDSINNVSNVDRNVARINGCLIGSSAGCLSSLVLTPTLGTFDPVRGDIFYADADFELPFDPLVGTNNDTLFGDVGTFGLSDIPLEPIECDKETDATCVSPDKDAK